MIPLEDMDYHRATGIIYTSLKSLDLEEFPAVVSVKSYVTGKMVNYIKDVVGAYTHPEWEGSRMEYLAVGSIKAHRLIVYTHWY